MNFPKDLNIIVPIIIVIVLVIAYYYYYSVKDMVQKEIKDFYVKTEKHKIKKTRREQELEMERNNIIMQQQMANNNRYVNSNVEMDNEIDYELMNLDEGENNDNEMDMESYVDPLKGRKENNQENNNTNQVLNDRIFNL